MLKPENMPGIGSMSDAFDFMKKMWGGMGTAGTGLPGMVMPTFSVEEINKQIADLKAVEAWLTVNMNMLRATIQALEVQSATLASLQAMGQNFAASMNQDAAAPASGRHHAADGSAHWAKRGHEAGAETEEKPKTQRKASPRSKRPASPSPSSQADGFAAPMADPAAWWSMLQQQFNQAVGSAMSDQEQEPEPEPPRASTGRKRKTQPRSSG